MAFTSRVENPGASATKVYWPAANTGKKNSPTAELWAENVLPVPLFVSVTLTPASKPPSLSCTWPDNCPPVCAKAARERAKTMEIARNVRKRLISYLPLNAHQIKSNVVHFWSKESRNALSVRELLIASLIDHAALHYERNMLQNADVI